MLAPETLGFFSRVWSGFGVEQNLETSDLRKDSFFRWSCKRHWSTSAEHSDLKLYLKHIPDRTLWLNHLLLWVWAGGQRLCCSQDKALWLQSHQLGLPGLMLLSQEPAELSSSSAHMQISQPAKLLLVQVRDRSTQAAYITHTQSPGS